MQAEGRQLQACEIRGRKEEKQILRSAQDDSSFAQDDSSLLLAGNNLSRDAFEW
jgi:hypothetical protein